MPWNETKPDVSLVIPVYRAIHQVVDSLARLDEFAIKSKYGVQIIFVDDGCDDGTSVYLENFAREHDAVMLIQHKHNMGKGRAIADGVAVATGSFVVFTDIDIPYHLSAVEQMIDRFVEDARIHMLAGSRRHIDSVHVRPYTLGRKIASWVFARVARLLVGAPCTDVQCGIKGFRLDAARLLFSDLKISRFAFDVELFMRAKQFGLVFEEVPVVFQHEPRSTVKLVPASMQMVRDMVRLRRTYGSAKKLH